MRDGSDLRAVSHESEREEHRELDRDDRGTPFFTTEGNSLGRRSRAQASWENISRRKRNKNLINTLPLPTTEV